VKKPVIVGIVIVLAVLGVLIYSTMNLAQHRVEVCLTFKGQPLCKRASGTSEEFALRTAITNICGELAGGVTEVMACQQTQPDKVTTLK